MLKESLTHLRSDGENLSKAPKKAGVSVEYREYKGVTHEFFGMGAVVDKAKDAVAFVGMQLKKEFGNG